jgi:hypothetical protein
MSIPVRASEQDLRALAGIVTRDRPDLPPGEGLPPSLLADLMGQIRCEGLLLQGFDSARQLNWGTQGLPAPADDAAEGGPGRDGHSSLAALLGLPVLQLARPRRRPAHRHQDLGLLLGQAMAQHRHARVHQRPDRPQARPVLRNGAHAPAEHLHAAECLQPHRRGHTRVPRSGREAIRPVSPIHFPGSQIAHSGRASGLGPRSRLGGLPRSWSSAPHCRALPTVSSRG